MAADAHRSHLEEQLPYLEQAILSVPFMEAQWFADFSKIKMQLKSVNEQLNGDPLRSRYEGQSRTSLKEKVELITTSLWTTTSGQTTTFERAYEEASDGFEGILSALSAIDEKIAQLEKALEKAGAPYTPGRFPVWEK